MREVHDDPAERRFELEIDGSQQIIEAYYSNGRGHLAVDGSNQSGETP
jgi:hypothetical protein